MRTPSPRCMSGTCLMAAPPSKRSPTVDEMRKRIQTVRDNGLPWLVALWRGAIVGYCYATFYRPRPAYRYTLEESIYVESRMGGRGIGSALLSS